MTVIERVRARADRMRATVAECARDMAEAAAEGYEGADEPCDSCAECAKDIALYDDVIAALEREAPQAEARATPREGLALAQRFHEAYERLAPSFGYETRAETRAFDPNTPNGRLMVAVCSEILAALRAPAEAQQAAQVKATAQEER